MRELIARKQDLKGNFMKKPNRLNISMLFISIHNSTSISETWKQMNFFLVNLFPSSRNSKPHLQLKWISNRLIMFNCYSREEVKKYWRKSHSRKKQKISFWSFLRLQNVLFQFPLPFFYWESFTQNKMKLNTKTL